MSSSKLIGLGGIAAVGSGALLVAGELMYFVIGVGDAMEGSAEVLASTSSIFQGMLFLLGGVLLVGAVFSVYSRYAAYAGTLGLAGFLVAFVGTVLTAGMLWDGAFILPALAAEAPALIESSEPPSLIAAVGFNLSPALFSAGWLLLGLAMFRTHSLPRTAAILLMLGAILSFIPMPFTYIPLGLAVAWVGLMSLKDAPLDESARTVK